MQGTGIGFVNKSLAAFSAPRKTQTTGSSQTHLRKNAGDRNRTCASTKLLPLKGSPFDHSGTPASAGGAGSKRKAPHKFQRVCKLIRLLVKSFLIMGS